MKQAYFAVTSAALVAAACGAAPTESTAQDTMTQSQTTPEQPTTDTEMTAESGTVVEVAQANPDFSTLVSLVSSAGLAETLSGPGPFTVFAPSNAAFEKIPEADRSALLQPAARQTLTGILTYHVVAGRVTAAQLVQQIEAGGGTARLTTVAGGTLTARSNGGTVTLTDAQGGTSTVTATDVAASNGVIHVIDTVLMP